MNLFSLFQFWFGRKEDPRHDFMSCKNFKSARHVQEKFYVLFIYVPFSSFVNNNLNIWKSFPSFMPSKVFPSLNIKQLFFGLCDRSFKKEFGSVDIKLFFYFFEEILGGRWHRRKSLCRPNVTRKYNQFPSPFEFKTFAVEHNAKGLSTPHVPPFQACSRQSSYKELENNS